MYLFVLFVDRVKRQRENDLPPLQLPCPSPYLFFRVIPLYFDGILVVEQEYISTILLP